MLFFDFSLAKEVNGGGIVGIAGNVLQLPASVVSEASHVKYKKKLD
jgi:hypothetical protein